MSSFATPSLAHTDHADGKGEREQREAQKSIAESLNNIAADYHNFTKRVEGSREAEPCNPGENKYYSELCAQWKAADGAADSARWAWISGLIGGLSLIGVGGALYLTYKSNHIARDTAQKQLRAYVGVTKVALDTATGTLWIGFKNFGSTPACDVNAHSRYTFDPENWTVPFAPHPFDVMDPGIEYEAASYCLTPDCREIFLPHDRALKVFVKFSYADIYGNKYDRKIYYSLPIELPRNERILSLHVYGDKKHMKAEG